MLDDTAYVTEFTADFLKEVKMALEDLEKLTTELRVGNCAPEPAMARLGKECARLRQMAYWAHQPLIDLTFRRLHDYLGDMGAPNDYQIDDINAFLDVVWAILENEIEVGADQAEFVRSLPARMPAVIEDVAHLDIEILIADPDFDTILVLERELRNCGYRVAAATNFFDALELSVRTRPDLVISATALDELSGVELARALRALSATRNIPFILLTGFTVDQASVQGLPEDAAVVRRGEGFSEDLAAALQQFRII
jgi:CheY-like chemotaxis protein